ncbi:hypothetical protein ADL30_02195 [Streptomyces sp. NRRL S-1521]|nr:hypothetical protein ADL30_02195 [Streptomyces sp. NRRL S-1521]
MLFAGIVLLFSPSAGELALVCGPFIEVALRQSHMRHRCLSAARPFGGQRASAGRGPPPAGGAVRLFGH